MARLTPEVLEEGRTYIRNLDLQGLIAWRVAHAPRAVDPEVFREMFEKIVATENVGKGLAVFNAVFPTYDPVVRRTMGCMMLAGVALLFLGLLGGALYLFRSVF